MSSPRVVKPQSQRKVRRKMEQTLEQVQKMEAVGQLTGGIAHDFNNILTVILGNLEMLEGLVRGEEERALLHEAEESARLGAQLTERLLAFARRQPLDPRPVELVRQIAEITVLLRRTLGGAIEIRTATPPDLPDVLVDATQLQTALLNLALNARDAMEGHGTLAIEAAVVDLDADYAASHAEIQPGRYVLVAVSDDGAGMSAEVRERAFEPFFTTKPVGMGTGLGLSMVYGFIKQSGGHAQIYSEPGQGTTVRLYLPIAPSRARAQAPTGRSSPLMFPARGETVLVVEDDPRVRRVSATRLRRLGYRVLEAEDGPGALRLLAERPLVDLLFTDMVMPGGMTGVDLAHEARKHLPTLKVLYTSGYAAPNLLRQGIDEGDVWLRKPYAAFDLARTLRAVLDSRPAAAVARPSLAADVGGEQVAGAADRLDQ